MTVMVHLSDLHLLSGRPDSEPILASLLAALEEDRRRRARTADLVVVTGDVFDTGTIDPKAAAKEWYAVQRAIRHALGGDVPFVLVPGNHDRRRMGLFGPHRDGIFERLRLEADERTFVHGTRTPFLADIVPEALHRRPLWLVAYDSTYLPSGYLSAGGVVRAADLLDVAARIGDREPDWPLVMLLHHHLVPTPLTDVGSIDTYGLGRAARLALFRILPVLVAHADREELTMTALGAGTALSTLESMGRAVLVLHGHKHVATVRKLEGPRAKQGDVLIAAGGSAGVAQPFAPGSVEGGARLWPSFNVLELDDEKGGGGLVVEQVSFGWKGRSAGRTVARPLVWAERRGARWALAPVPDEPQADGPILRENHANVVLSASSSHGRDRLDATCVRRVVRNGSPRPHRYVETVEARHGARIVSRGEVWDAPAQVELRIGEDSLFHVEGGYRRTRTSIVDDVPFESFGLLNRYHAESARLELRGAGVLRDGSFASATDLGTGEERPLRLHRRGDDGVVVEMNDCRPRTLLRVYWPLPAS